MPLPSVLPPLAAPAFAASGSSPVLPRSAADQAQAPARPGAPATAAPWPEHLVLPLAARARGAPLFARRAARLMPPDAAAERVLAALAIDAAPLLRRRAAVFAALARATVLRRRAADFLAPRPRSIGVVLGAGLSSAYLHRGGALWLDADAPAVMAWRRRLPVEATTPRVLEAAVDLDRPGWWQALALPRGRHDPPLLAVGEGLLARLDAARRESLLWAFGEFAPPGTRLLLDAAGGPGAGARGLRHPLELTAPHPRLRLDAVYPVFELRSLAHALGGTLWRATAGRRWHAVYELGVDA